MNRKWKIRIDGRGCFVIVDPIGAILGVSFTLDRLDLALREVQRQITKDRATSDMLRGWRGL